MSQVCDKRVYKTQQEAIQAINGFAGDNRAGRRSRKKPNRTYFCDICKGYHLHTEGKKHSPKKSHTVSIKTVKNNKSQAILHIRNYNV